MRISGSGSMRRLDGVVVVEEGTSTTVPLLVAFVSQKHCRTKSVGNEKRGVVREVEAVGGGSRDVEVTGRPTPEVKKNLNELWTNDCGERKE